MHLHEYQAKEVLQKYGIPVPSAFVINSIEELIQAPKHSEEAVLKIQVHAGGRGKGGGVRIAKSKAEQIKMAKEMLGMKLVNSQTGPKGLIAQQVLISEPVKIQKEYYLGIIADRAQACPVLIASPEGGMDIEEVAHKTPEKILKLSLSLN